MNSSNLPNSPRERESAPCDKESERMVIGCLLGCMNTEESEPWLARLDSECFHDGELRELFECMVELDKMEPPVSPHFTNVSVHVRTTRPKLMVTDAYLLELASRYLGSYDLSLPVEELRDMKVRRQLQQLGYYLEQAAVNQQLRMADVVEEAMRQLDVQDVGHKHRGTALHDVLGDLRNRVNENQNDPERHHGPYTGIEDLDRVGGLPESGLAVVAAGTSQGKSAMASLFALRSADHGMRSAYFSLELNNISLSSRMVSMTGRGISAQGIKSWKLNDTDWRRTLADIDRTDQLYGQMIYYDDARSTNLQDICAGIRYMHNAYGIRLAVVDFLQMLNFTTASSHKNTTTEQLIGHAARTLKNLGDRLGICVVVLCQINRSMERQRPTLGTIRDSGQVAEAADMAIFVWRPGAYNGSYDLDLSDYRTKDTMAFMVLKNREGALMERLLQWDGQHTLPIDIPKQRLEEYRRGLF